MPVTIYRSTDAGAPTFPALSAQAQPGFFIDLLKACLVDGYGSKPGAGWSVDYEDTTTGKRRIGLSNGNGVFEVVTWGSYSVGFFLWDSITTPGTGRLYDDPWASVISEGVNGWKDELVSMPGAEGDHMMGAYCYDMRSGNETNAAWTVFADDKAAWVLFHRAQGHSNTDPEDSIDAAKTAYSVQLFVGALKSPDLNRSGAGNLFIGYGGRNAPTTANCTGGSHDSLTYLWGLRTPMDTLPTTGNGSEFELDGASSSNNNQWRNSRSSVRLVTPVMVFYNGADVPAPAGLGSIYSEYGFAVLPGVGQFSIGNSSNSYFWSNYNQDNGAAWSLDPAVIAGDTWMPWSLGSSPFYEVGITDSSDWW
ncbi:MAG: hypothetical protein MI745_07265 [Pseudomonadales bacterium]|nr:hypothetical protein [Pseudomonadales bacterium]